mgnify:CR=1 FL=1
MAKINDSVSGHSVDVNDGSVRGATITVGAEDTNSINVAVQLFSDVGKSVECTAVSVVTAILSDSASTAVPCTTAPDGDIAVGTDGAILLEHVADKVFVIESEADGDFDLDIGEASAGTWYLHVVLPDGSVEVSPAITFAA